MNNNEYNELQITEIDFLNKFYERFWRWRDPNLASDQNERIPEYYRRLSYARKNYSRSTSGKSDKTSFYQFEHPIKVFRVKMGDVLLNPLVSKVLSKVRDLDDLVLIYVRHGGPISV
jgi:GWxTD domain-containing protein